MNNHTMPEAVRQAYRRGQNEEMMEPIVLFGGEGQPIGRIRDGDQVIFYDIRGEREIELTKAFVESDFRHFKTALDLETDWVTMIEYSEDLPVKVAFPPLGEVRNTLCEVISCHGFHQVKISESEKAIHVGYFLNGKKETFFSGEQRIVIDSPENAGNYESTPQMNAKGVADETINRIEDPNNRFIITNFCNVDVLGHTENKKAILKAVNIVDTEMGRVVEKALRYDFMTLITSDHGTVERYFYPEGAIDTGHTISDVPFICVSNDHGLAVSEQGELIDVAPTILGLLGIFFPSEFRGKNLIKKSGKNGNSNRRVLLIILDGWGFNPDRYGNLIEEAETPVFDKLIKENSHALLRASGEAVGLPAGTVGNSEVGHLHLGSGRMVPSDKVRIANALNDKSFYRNEVFVSAMDKAKRNGVNLHLVGIVSFFSSHGSIEYPVALLKMAKERGVENVFIHGLLGRRGERPESGAYYVRQIEEETERLDLGQVVSVIGRHWALDREENWDRVEKTYRMLVYGEGQRAVIGDN